MKTVAALVFMVSSSAFAGQVEIQKCYKTTLTNRVVSVCDAKLGNQFGYVYLLADGRQIVYSASAPVQMGTDETFGTTMFVSQLKLEGQYTPASGLSQASGVPQKTQISKAYFTTTNKLEAIQGSDELPFIAEAIR